MSANGGLSYQLLRCTVSGSSLTSCTPVTSLGTTYTVAQNFATPDPGDDTTACYRVRDELGQFSSTACIFNKSSGKKGNAFSYTP